MKYKAIVTDLDDTLLNPCGLISPEDKKMIMECQENGVKFILASGRPTFAMKHLSEELELSKYKSYILSFNGAIITDCSTGELLLNESLTSKEIHELYDFAKENNVHIITYIDDEIISESESEYIDVEVNLTKMPHKIVKSFKESVKKDAVKCIMLEEPSYLKEVEKKLKEKYGDKYSIAISKPFFLEVTKKGIDKGNTLKKLADKMNISTEEIIAVGDSYNDESMLRTAGLAVAVENAKPEIKEIADFITTSNDNNGMGNLIKKFILK
ncbi:MAG: Cof-type HAD-IIB family hydrolase [Cetobacterium sp.]|nr:Cof-type HAD-IIB family hydrolase [Cetobacterium sp.]